MTDDLRPAFLEATMDNHAGMLLVGRMDAKLDLVLAAVRDQASTLQSHDVRLRSVENAVVPRTEITAMSQQRDKEHSELADRVFTIEKGNAKMLGIWATVSTGVSLFGSWLITHIWK